MAVLDLLRTASDEDENVEVGGIEVDETLGSA